MSFFDIIIVGVVMIKIKINSKFDIHSTITSGQIFRFDVENDGSYTVILKDRIVNLKFIGNELFVESNNEDNLETIIIDYLDLKRDYESIDNFILSKESKLKTTVMESKGLKMVHSFPFETSISYIISARNSVPSISRSVNILSEKYGTKTLFKDKTYYLFPTPQQLKNVSIKDYNDAKTGFRDKYLYEFVQRINSKEINLESINSMSTKEAFDYLLDIKGIGPKVASCILLFAYSRFDVFPIDTWVMKAANDLYGTSNIKEIEKITYDKFGEYVAIALQYMFHWKRNLSGK